MSEGIDDFDDFDKYDEIDEDSEIVVLERPRKVSQKRVVEEVVYYVRNKDLIPEIQKFNETDRISEELGRMLLLIAKNLSNKSNFINYTWKDDMIQEAVLTCCKYLKNFDLEKSNNPFAYITTICSHAFVNYINKQKRHSEIKDTLFHNRQDMEDDFGMFQTKAIDYTVMSDDLGKKRFK